MSCYLQLPIKAGHEFVISTEDKYNESCDDKVLWLDYVRMKYLFVCFSLIYFYRKTCQRSLHPASSSTLMTVGRSVIPFESFIHLVIV
jgi:hypothetical protein